jgi:hypothetical protein
MATAYTSLLGLALPVTGELSGSWGDTVNDAITSLLDTAVAGTTSITADADITLTTTTGVANQSRQAIILWNPASGTTTRNITAPAQSKIYTVINASGGTQSIVFRGAGPTTGVTIVKGESSVVAWNGTDFIKVSNTGGSASFTNVTVSGTTTLSGLTASTALALDASKNVVSVTNTGTGNNVLATSPTLVTPALGTPSSGVVTNLTGTASININGTVGATTANTGAFTTLTTSSTVTHNGGTANGVAYLNGSKVLTTGSALTFDGTNLETTGNTTLANNKAFQIKNTGGTAQQVLTLGNDNNVYLGQVTSPTAASLFLYGNQQVFSAGGSEQMRLTSTGLGIGTSSPSQKLTVDGNAVITSSSADRFLNITAGNTNNGYIQFAEAAVDNQWAIGFDGDGSNYANLQFRRRAWGSALTAMTLDSSGNLGLGVTPSAWLTLKAFEFGTGTANGTLYGYNNEVGLSTNTYYNTGYKYISAGAASQYRQYSGIHAWYTAPSGTAGNAISFTQAMTLDASGNLGVGTSSPYSPNGKNLHLNDAGGTVARLTLSATRSYSINSANDNALNFFDNTAGAERARIDSSGNLLVNYTSRFNAEKFGVQFDGNTHNGIGVSDIQTDGDFVRFFRSSTTQVGSISHTSTATSYNTSSDYRLKNTIAPITGALAKVALLKPCTYKWNADGSDGEGFIAHELAEVVPQCVTGEKDAVDAEGNPKYQGIDTSFLVATLTAAIQELKAEFDAYKANHP